jgi:hypothetical protein
MAKGTLQARSLRTGVLDGQKTANIIDDSILHRPPVKDIEGLIKI